MCLVVLDLFSLSTVSSRFIYVVACVKISFLKAEEYSIVSIPFVIKTQFKCRRIYHFFSSLGCSMISYLKFFGKPKVTQILLFSSRIFVILDFTFMSMIYFELIVIRCKLEVDLALFYCKAGNRLLLVFYILICTQKFTKLFFFFSFF